jgi:hypothetical protein
VSTIACDICGAPAVWRVIADAARSAETTGRFVCSDERHLISARESLAPCSVVPLDEQPGDGRTR